LLGSEGSKKGCSKEALLCLADAIMPPRARMTRAVEMALACDGGQNRFCFTGNLPSVQVVLSSVEQVRAILSG